MIGFFDVVVIVHSERNSDKKHLTGPITKNGNGTVQHLFGLRRSVFATN